MTPYWTNKQFFNYLKFLGMLTLMYYIVGLGVTIVLELSLIAFKVLEPDTKK